MDCMEENAADCEQLEEETTDLNPENEEIFAETEQSGSLILDIVKSFFALILVLALIYTVLKLLNNKNKFTSQGKVLENLSGISVGPNKSLQLVRIGSKVYLIGVGENVQLLDEITDEEMKTELINQATADKGSNVNTFISSLIPSKSDSSNKKDFNQLFSNELEKLKENRKQLIKKQKEEHDYDH